ncbi:hypothetical protein SELMODRAFT_87412 [Selaginella moellendorffii]|uniref:Pentacotripeptide-repeat region of PRORP domain-containing protein n=2 Tax=Selaginella moellendorffii TaxID=88036 RepID=D8R7F2_SELML|nr:hypothetical protein SELMODRAFT_87412 [Selaginella moellendorffii]
MPERDTASWNAILAAFAQCGHVAHAELLFEQMPRRSLVSWNAMISMHGRSGRFHRALDLLCAMRAAGFQPDQVSYLSVLAACNHVGLVEESSSLFLAMAEELGGGSGIEHYSSMVDLLGRAGQVEFAREIIQSMPFVPDAKALGALSGARKLHVSAK